ncbi:MAG TPA: glycosyltransferase family 4 protein [Bryobacteraceae bacterium]
MKILAVDQYSEMGGAQRCLVEAVEGFAARGWDVRAAVPQSNPDGGALTRALAPFCTEIRALACGPFASGDKSGGDILRFAWQLPRQVARIASMARDCDVVYVNGPRLLPAAALGHAGRPLIHHVHWMVPQQKAAALARAAMRRSSAWAIVASHAAARWLEGAVEPGRITTVYNGIAGFGASPRQREEVRRIALLGRLSPEKGPLEFVRAAKLVSERVGGLRFTVCGGPVFSKAAGDGENYIAMLRAEAAGAPVEFSGWTEDVGALLSRTDLLVVPSDATDHAPRVILEAFAAGVPVLATAVGAIPELIEHGVNGLLVRDRTPETLAQAIVSAASQPDRLNTLAARAFERWRERYTLRRFQSEVCDAVEGVSRRHHQRNPLASAGANAAA